MSGGEVTGILHRACDIGGGGGGIVTVVCCGGILKNPSVDGQEKTLLLGPAETWTANFMGMKKNILYVNGKSK